MNINIKKPCANIIYFSIIGIILGISSSCISTTQKLKIGDIIQTSKEERENSLSKEDISYLSTHEFVLQSLVLIVEYGDTGDYDMFKDNRNKDAKILEARLYELLKIVARDLLKDKGVILNYDGIIKESVSAVSNTRISQIETSVFNWVGLAYKLGQPYRFLVSDWIYNPQDEVYIPSSNRASLSISLINKKNFLGFKVLAKIEHVDDIPLSSSTESQKSLIAYEYEIE